MKTAVPVKRAEPASEAEDNKTQSKKLSEFSDSFF